MQHTYLPKYLLLKQKQNIIWYDIMSSYIRQIPFSHIIKAHAIRPKLGANAAYIASANLSNGPNYFWRNLINHRHIKILWLGIFHSTGYDFNLKSKILDLHVKYWFNFEIEFFSLYCVDSWVTF